MRSFRYKKDVEYEKTIIRNMMVVLALIIFVVVVVVYKWKTLVEKGRISDLLLGIAVFSLCVVIGLVIMIRELLLNAREIEIDEKGVLIKSLQEKRYSWNEIRTVAFDNPRTIKVNEGGTPKYKGKVLIISPTKIRRIRYCHPFIINKYLFINMICIYFEGKKTDKYISPELSKMIDYSFFGLYEGSEEEYRQAFKEWGVVTTYDYQFDYYSEWNSRKLKEAYEEIELIRLSVGGTDFYEAKDEKGEMVGIWLKKEGYDAEKVLENIKSRVASVYRVVLNNFSDKSIGARAKLIFPEAELTYRSSEMAEKNLGSSIPTYEDDNELKLKIVYALLKNDRSVDRELLWKIGQQAYHW